MHQPVESYDLRQITEAIVFLESYWLDKPQLRATLARLEATANAEVFKAELDALKAAGLCAIAGYAWLNAVMKMPDGLVAKRILLIEKVRRFLGMAVNHLYREITNKTEYSQLVPVDLIKQYFNWQCRYLGVNYLLDSAAIIKDAIWQLHNLNANLRQVFDPKFIIGLLQETLDDAQYPGFDMVRLDYWYCIHANLAIDMYDIKGKYESDKSSSEARSKYKEVLSLMLARNALLLCHTNGMPHYDDWHEHLYKWEKDLPILWEELWEAFASAPEEAILPSYALHQEQYTAGLEPITPRSDLMYRDNKKPAFAGF